jgi:hypothetical protein
VRGQPVQINVHQLTAGKYMEYEDKDYEDFDMLNTDRVIVKGHINFKFKENKKEVEVTRPTLRDGCNLDEFKSFTLQWRLYAGCQGEMNDRELRQQLLNCTDGPLEATMYDTPGSKVDTLS